MKKFLLTVSLAILGIIALPLSTFAGQRIDGLSTSDSGCHQDTRSDNTYDETNPNAWDLDYTNGILSITWINFVANCCPDGFSGWFEMEDNNHLIYTLKSNDDLCYCLCLYDVTTTFGEFAPGHYTITFRSYEDIFSAEIDIEEGSSIHLEKSPAGIHSLTPESDMMSLSVDGILHIDAPGKLVVEIYNAAGAIQTRINAADRADIDITSLRKGIYIAKLISGDGSSTLRFIR